jgi:hypothetical protein
MVTAPEGPNRKPNVVAEYLSRNKMLLLTTKRPVLQVLPLLRLYGEAGANWNENHSRRISVIGRRADGRATRIERGFRAEIVLSRRFLRCVMRRDQAS